MRVAILRGAAAATLLAALAGCQPNPNANVVNASQANVAQTVQFGTVTGARPVQVQKTGGNELLGGIVGGIAGAALGNTVGKGTGQDVATGVGAAAGVAAGSAAARAAGTANSVEWFVRLDSGANISVIQTEPAFATGQRVRVISGGGQTRLAPA